MFKREYLWTYIISSIVGTVSFGLYLIISLSGVILYESQSISFFLMGLACLWAPALLTLITRLRLSLTVVIIFECFVQFSVFWGSMWNLYDIVSVYDLIAHSFSGVLFAVIGYELFSKNGKNKASYVWIFIISFAIACMAGSLWEIWEFAGDRIFGLNAQRVNDLNGVPLVGSQAIMDTMEDTICNTIGALIGSSLAVIFQKKKDKINNNTIYNRLEIHDEVKK